MSSLRMLLVLAACSGWVMSQPAPTFKIAGHVVRRADNHPVKRVRVSISMIDHADRQISCITGDNGEFSFVGVAPSKYTLQVNDHGWAHNFQQLDDFSTAIAVGPGLDSEHIVFPLDSPARITGSVLDEEGDPVPGAIVYLFARSLVRGLVQTQLNGQTNTSADGDFHFTRLAPGAYYIAATGHPWYAQNYTKQIQGVQLDQGVSHSELDLAYPLVYHDGGLNPEEATPLKLGEGDTAEIHFTLHAVPALHIGVDGFQKQEGLQLNLQLSQIGPGGILINAASGSDSGVVGIAPGYYVVSSLIAGQNQSSTLGLQSVKLTADSTVDLSDAVQTSVKGKVIVDGDLPPSMAIWMGNLNNGNQSVGFVTPQGTFDMSNILPGRYAVLLANASDFFMQSVKVKGGVYRNGELPVAKGADMQLTITAVKGVTKVNGTAVNGTKAVAGAMVLLLPHDPNHGNNIPRDQSDSDGTFTLNWALPGRYTLVAIDNGRGLAYADLTVIAPYLQGGQILDLPLAKDATVQIEVQSRK